jgi:hypothetical protein
VVAESGSHLPTVLKKIFLSIQRTFTLFSPSKQRNFILCWILLENVGVLTPKTSVRGMCIDT